MSFEPGVDALLAHRAGMLAMTADGLSLDGVSLAAIARESGTPAWVIGAATIRARHARLASALARRGIPASSIHYAIKANDRLAILELMAGLGAGADAVSMGEIERARAAGVAPERIVFSGVGKTATELARAVELGVGQVNVESVEELRELASIARAAGRVQAVALRVNPDIDAGTHGKISTGRAGDKFGLAIGGVLPAYAEAALLEGIRPVGLAVHIGSQIMTGAPFRATFELLAGLVRTLRVAGLDVQTVDAGGGLGISYEAGPDADPEEFADALADAFGGLGLRLAVEPGRWLVGPAGVLLASVLRVKQADPPFLILDAAMNDLLRPALYGAWHGLVPVAPGRGPVQRYDVVGPVCESSDVLARGRALPACSRGDLVAILDAGAYGAVMSSTYNARPLAAEILVDSARVGGTWRTIRRRQALEAIWHDELGWQER